MTYVPGTLSPHSIYVCGDILAPQFLDFSFCDLKHKVLRKALDISLYLTIKVFVTDVPGTLSPLKTCLFKLNKQVLSITSYLYIMLLLVLRHYVGKLYRVGKAVYDLIPALFSPIKLSYPVGKACSVRLTVHKCMIKDGYIFLICCVLI